MTLHEWLEQGPFTLTLSSGYFGFFAHFGILAALEENNLFPSKITGSSAGALAGAIWASGYPIQRITHSLFRLSKADFWDPSLGPGLLKGQLFRQFINKLCPVSNIEDCPIPLAVSAFDLRSLSTHALIQGKLSDAVYASCCVPLLFQPIRIRQALYIDGGIKDRAGLAGVSGNTPILYHHLLSQWPPVLCKWETAPRIPHRPDMVTVIIENLQSVGPHRMDRGKTAFDQAKRSIGRALESPMEPQIISI